MKMQIIYNQHDSCKPSETCYFYSSKAWPLHSADRKFPSYCQSLFYPKKFKNIRKENHFYQIRFVKSNAKLEKLNTISNPFCFLFLGVNINIPIKHTQHLNKNWHGITSSTALKRKETNLYCIGNVLGCAQSIG